MSMVERFSAPIDFSETYSLTNDCTTISTALNQQQMSRTFLLRRHVKGLATIDQ